MLKMLNENKHLFLSKTLIVGPKKIVKALQCRAFTILFNPINTLEDNNST